MGETYDDEKRRIRRVMCARRLALEADVVRRSSAAVCDRVLALPAFARAERVVLYAAVQNEVDPSAIGERAVAEGKTVYLPHGDGDRPEFVAPSGPPLAVDDGVLFVVPGVAFDEGGGRLGRGLGWYDRALARHPGGVRVGIAYEFQMVPRLPQEPWDVAMHAVATEARLKENHP